MGMLGGPGPQGSHTLLNQPTTGTYVLAPEPISAMGLAPASVEPSAGCWAQGQVIKSW